MISIIVAVSQNGVIGFNGEIPWNIKEEMRHFSETTKDSCVLMGRKTYESLPDKYRPLPNRVNVIISPTWYSKGQRHFKGVVVVKNLEHGIDLLKKLHAPKEIFIIGGERVYLDALHSNFVDRVILSLIHQDFEGDKFFPSLYPEDWTCSNQRKYNSFTIFTYERIRSQSKSVG